MARGNPKMADDSDEDNMALSFKRTKQTHSNTEEKRISSYNHDSKSDEDSEDDKPLNYRHSAGLSNGGPNPVKKVPSSVPSSSPHQSSSPQIIDEDSDDDKPLSSKIQLKSNGGASTSEPYDSDDEKPLSSKIQKNGLVIRDNQAGKLIGLNKRPSSEAKSSGQSSVKKPKLSDPCTQTKPDDDDDDHVPISHRIKKPSQSDSKSSSVKQKGTKVGSSSLKKPNKNSKKVMKKSKHSKSSKHPPKSGGGIKWTNMEHNGVIFPPPYTPHGVKILYGEGVDKMPVDLTPDQEEVATMYALMIKTEYVTDDKKSKPICKWHQREKDKEKKMIKEEKKAIKEEKMKLEEKYRWAVIDGVKQQVGNFRVEPPGLFRGQGNQPKMGKLKKRIQPSDVVINIGKDAPIPECPIPGQSWKEVRHDNTVTWLACWFDPIPKELKYVQLAASSFVKGQSDMEKYEKARKLKDHIQIIRTSYTKIFGSEDATEQQIAVATYLIDKLALRAGNEKDVDEADTVGCCTLKVEHVEPKPPNILKFEFVGKDSIEYKNEVEVELPVYKAIQQFRSGKTKGAPLFDKLDTNKLNTHLKGLMPELTAKVFRTYNASITLDEMLSRETEGGNVDQKLAVHQRANKQVAIICNHQRTESSTHGKQMGKLNEEIDKLKAILEEHQTDLSLAKKGKLPLKSADDRKTKRNLTPEAIEKKISKINAQIEKKKRHKETKEEFKTIALGTSKINYLDPRISVAWCKRHEVPIQKIFSKSQLEKFAWAMDIDPSFRF